MTPADPHTVVVNALGIDIALTCMDAHIADHVRAAWANAVVSEGHAAGSALTVGTSSTCEVTGRDVNEVLHHLSPAVTLRAMQGRAGELVMLHAAALADLRTGATAVLVAPSGTGKTTAALTLGRRFAYVTDETSAIDADGMLVPHRKPLSIIRGGHLKAQVSPTALGLLTTERPCHLAAMLVIERDTQHVGDPVVTTLGTIDALELLTPQASSLGRLERPLHRLVELIDRVGGVRHVTYAEASTLEPVVAGLLDGAIA